jgi:hypothetical protein
MHLSYQRINLRVECLYLHKQSLRERTECLHLRTQCLELAAGRLAGGVGVGTVIILSRGDAVRHEVIKHCSVVAFYDRDGWTSVGVNARAFCVCVARSWHGGHLVTWQDIVVIANLPCW